MLNDPLANMLSKIMNAENLSKRSCLIKPVSTIIKNVLKIMQENQYIGEYKEIEDGRGNYIKVNLLGKINKCGAIKPRYSINKNEFVKFEKRYLIAKDFGIIIISTPLGIMTHNEAKEKKTGGRLLAYCY
jgi:small subunit ribosomal protein S8